MKLNLISSNDNINDNLKTFQNINFIINNSKHNILLIDNFFNSKFVHKLQLLNQNYVILNKHKKLEDYLNQNLHIYYLCDKLISKEIIIKYRNLIENIYTISENKEDVFNFQNLILHNNIELEECFINIYKLEKSEELNYLNLLREVLENGNLRSTRNANTYSLFSKNLTFDLSKGFPLLTTKKMFLRGIFEELMFFIKGETNTKILEEKGVNIWKGNTSKEFIEKCNLPYKEGDMGPMYGFQWRHFGADYKGSEFDYTRKGYDQIEEILDLLLKDPYSRRIIMTNYNPTQSKCGVLFPCHSIVLQFYVTEMENKKMVSMNMYQRSVDSFLGLPFNISSNALFLHLICNVLNSRINSEIYFPHILNIIMGDVHIYEEHIDSVKTQLERIPLDFPKIEIKQKNNLEDFLWEDINVLNYKFYESIKAKMIV